MIIPIYSFLLASVMNAIVVCVCFFVGISSRTKKYNVTPIEQIKNKKLSHCHTSAAPLSRII